MTTEFRTDRSLERVASILLGRYETEYAAVPNPPVPVERIMEDTLDLAILWESVPEPDGQSILAALHPDARTVVFNETRRSLITDTKGLYNTVLAHEAGHWELHVDRGLQSQQHIPDLDPGASCLYRSSGPGRSIRERQAHRFMGYLLMPTGMILQSVRGKDLTNWSTLYRLRDEFQVTITALTVRLSRLGLLHVTEDGELYPSREEYEGQLRIE